ncbi:MAG: roadblock/LC7 domain-containing protein [Verrucomicrobiota bacterium]
MDRTRINDQLRALLSGNKEIKGAVVSTRDGLLLSNVGTGFDADRIAAMISTALGLGYHMLGTADLGELREINFAAEGGILSIYSVGTVAVLAVISKPNSNFGMIQLQARRCAEAVNPEVELAR